MDEFYFRANVRLRTGETAKYEVCTQTGTLEEAFRILKRDVIGLRVALITLPGGKT